MLVYHVLNRGVDKRNIFLDDQDRFRFIHDLFEFNSLKRSETVSYQFYSSPSFDIASRKIENKERLVDINFFCLMDNHYHLLISPLVENGVSNFMKKVNIGYAKYFNTKYKRVGTLFQGRYKSIPVEKEHHFNYIPFYIHFNPLDLKMPEWREGKLKSIKSALEFLESYRWSSHLDYLGKKNFPSILKRDEFLTLFSGENGYKESLNHWLQYVADDEFVKMKLE